MQLEKLKSKKMNFDLAKHGLNLKKGFKTNLVSFWRTKNGNEGRRRGEEECSRSIRSLLSSSVKCSMELLASKASWRTWSNVVTLTSRSPLTACNSSLANRSSSSASMLQVKPVLHKLLNRVPYLSSEAGPLRGQGGNLSLISLHRPNGALIKVGPPCQALHVSSHLPKNKKESINNLKQ